MTYQSRPTSFMTSRGGMFGWFATTIGRVYDYYILTKLYLSDEEHVGSQRLLGPLDVIFIRLTFKYVKVRGRICLLFLI